MERGESVHCGWVAVIHMRFDTTHFPVHLETIRRGIYPSLEKALEEGRKKCDELEGLGYTAERSGGP